MAVHDAKGDPRRGCERKRQAAEVMDVRVDAIVWAGLPQGPKEVSRVAENVLVRTAGDHPGPKCLRLGLIRMRAFAFDDEIEVVALAIDSLQDLQQPGLGSASIKTPENMQDLHAVKEWMDGSTRLKCARFSRIGSRV